MQYEKVNKFPIFFFSTGVLLNCLFFSKTVLDHTLVPRFIFLALFILVFFTYTLFCFKSFKLYIDKLILPYLLFTVYSFVSIFWSINSSLSIIESSKIILYFFIFILSYKLLNYYSEDFLSILLKVIIILFFLSSIEAVIQLIEIPEMTRKYLYNINGISGHKNLYSSFVFLCSIFSFLSLFYLKPYWKVISLFALICQLLLIIILQTRAVWIGYTVFFVSGSLIFLINKKIKFANYKYIIICIITSLILINFFFIFAFPRILNIYYKNKPFSSKIEQVSDLSTLSERVLIWEKTYDGFFKHPFFGVGANNWQIYFPSSSLPDIYPMKDLNVTFQRPHNDFLWILSEYGIIGFNLFFIFIVAILMFLFFSLLNNFKITHVIIISGVLGFLAISFFDFPRERIEHNILLSLLLGISYYLIKKETSSLETELLHIPKFVSKIFIIIFIFIFYFAFLNFKGEYFTKKMYVERQKKNNADVINLCNIAESICYTIDPTSVPLSWYKGNANANLGNYSVSLDDFKNAFHAHPFNHQVLNDLGSSYFMNNNIDSAKIFYRESARINPRFDDPKLNLIATYINEGNYKEAEKWNNSIFHDSERRNYYIRLLYEHK